MMQLKGDIKFYFTTSEHPGDVKLNGSDLVNDPGLETSVLISLFSDARANPDDKLPNDQDTLRGWWADTLMSRPIGSKLWLLSRSKINNTTLKLAKDYTEQSLSWMIIDDVATSVNATTEQYGQNQINFSVVITRENGSNIFFKFYLNWASQTAGGIA